jgi:hypothetical protein
MRIDIVPKLRRDGIGWNGRRKRKGESTRAILTEFDRNLRLSACICGSYFLREEIKPQIDADERRLKNAEEEQKNSNKDEQDVQDKRLNKLQRLAFHPVYPVHPCSLLFLVRAHPRL